MSKRQRDSIWSIDPRYKVFYSVIFLAVFLTGGATWEFPDNTSLAADLAALGVASATIAFVFTEIVDLGRMIYQALKEIRQDRRQRRDIESEKRGAQKERKRLLREMRDAGLDVQKWLDNDIDKPSG